MTWLNFYKFIDKIYYIPDMHLPEIHRRWNKRWLHDDLLLWKWFRVAIPRWWDALPQVKAPRMIAGSQNYWNFSNPQDWDDPQRIEMLSSWASEVIMKDHFVFRPEIQISNDIANAKPIPKSGQFQLSLCYPKFFDFEMVLPYFAITLKNGYHFRIGCRWTDDDSGHYYILFSIAIRKF